MAPPRLGVNFTVRDERPRSEAAAFARRIEELGYDSIWVGESWGRELFSTLTFLACNTRRIQVAAGIANVYSRTPSLLAQSIATLDEISGGRAVLGLGSSGAKVVRDWHGIPFERPVERTREYMEIVNLALSGERVNYDGQFFRLRDFRLGFTPPRKHVPLFIAALGARNIELTGELADGWNPIYVSPRHVQGFRRQLAEGAAKRGRQADAVDVRPYVIVCVSRDVAQAQALARGHLAFYVGGMGRYYHDLIARYGYVEEAALVKQRWGRRDRAGAAAAVSDAMLEELAVLGPPERCRRKLVDLQAAGMGSPVIYIPNGTPDDLVRETIEGVAPSAFR